MKKILTHILNQALLSLQQTQFIPENIDYDVRIERSKDPSHGDFATNIALTLAKPCKKSPKAIAEAIVQFMTPHEIIKNVEIAGPGFINFYLETTAQLPIVNKILQAQDKFGQNNLGQGQKILMEFVSANPTGPLHVGHGRGAAFGATLANVLRFCGYRVDCEYYVNDAGRQMNILAASVWARYLELLEPKIPFPCNGYRGYYVIDIAKSLHERVGNRYHHNWANVCQDLPADEVSGGDKELYIDAFIAKAHRLLGTEGFKTFHQAALNFVLEDIKDDLKNFGVAFERWFSEQTLEDSGAIYQAIEVLKERGYTYKQEGALWFRSSDFGDEKDRVLLRTNGSFTYFASDVAYHWNKFERGFDKIIDVFGADHHGYVSRIKAAVEALGHKNEDMDALLVQFAILYRGKTRVQMSTRSGSFVTLRELRDEVGNDAARFFYVMRKREQHMDFDLELAKSQSNDNPVYYIQYAHARICSVMRQLGERGHQWSQDHGLSHLEQLNTEQEQHLISVLNRFEETLIQCAQQEEPHQLAYYLRELANGLHSYYNAVVILCKEPSLRDARLSLLQAVRHCLANGLKLLGVCAPESM